MWESRWLTIFVFLYSQMAAIQPFVTLLVEHVSGGYVVPRYLVDMVPTAHT